MQVSNLTIFQHLMTRYEIQAASVLDHKHRDKGSGELNSSGSVFSCLEDFSTSVQGPSTLSADGCPYSDLLLFCGHSVRPLVTKTTSFLSREKCSGTSSEFMGRMSVFVEARGMTVPPSTSPRASVFDFALEPGTT